MNDMYDLYRRLALESLQAEAEQHAQRLGDIYRANLAALRQTELEAARYGSTPEMDARYAAVRQQWHAQYQAGLADLSQQIAAQAAQIDADYDAKEQGYTDALGSPWPTSTAAVQPEWEIAPAPAYGVPRSVTDTPVGRSLWADAESSGESWLGSLLSYFK